VHLPGRETCACSWSHEPQRPGEDEVETALRLLARVIPAYQRPSDVCWPTRLRQGAVFQLSARAANTLWWFSGGTPHLYQTCWISDHVAPQPVAIDPARPWWDFPDLLSWPQVQAPVRVVRSWNLHGSRQLDKQDDPQTSDWIWATTLPPPKFPSIRIVHLGAPAMDIENYGFNELANEWHSDHVFKHDPAPFECFCWWPSWLTTFFHVFLRAM